MSYVQSIPDSKYLLFKNSENEDFLEQITRNSKYTGMSFLECEIYNFFTVNCYQDNIVFPRVILGLKEGSLLIFENNLETNIYQCIYSIQLRDCYMRKQDNKNTSQKYQKFDIIKNKQHITFIQLENNSQQKWSAFLNNYVIRLDLPRRYKIIKSIGEGSNAQVFKAKKIQYTSLDCIEEMKQLQIEEQKTHRYYALKSLNKSSFDNFESFKTLILNEINALRKLKLCDNIIQLYKVYETSSHLFMLMEYSEGGSLVGILQKQQQIQEMDIQMIMAQLLLSVDYIHQMNFIHRDLKLDNILLNSRQDFNYDLRVADFGLSTELKPGQYLTAKCGTPTYIAPEMLQGDPYDTKVDIFALGSIMYNLITGKFLFESKRQDDILYLNKKCDLSHVKLFTKDVSFECRDLLDMLLQKNPVNRPTAREALQHPWFSSDRQALEAGLLINNYQLCPFERNQNITSIMINLNNNSAALSQSNRRYIKQTTEKLFSNAHQKN